MLCRARKLAQMAAYFLRRGGDGPMDWVKLMKLMYLADRECMDQYWFPISYDEYYSMEKGPVLSMSLNLMNGSEDPEVKKWIDAESQQEWNNWVSPRVKFHVSPQKEIIGATLDELADEEIAVMERVFDKYGDWDMWDLVEHTHRYLKEWKEPPPGSRLQITLRSIFEALGKPADEIEAALRCLVGDKENTASPPSVPATELLARLANFNPDPPTDSAVYAGNLDAIFSAG